jgi:Zn finger protein HypA/HybF involved in hydrogenase expression
MSTNVVSSLRPSPAEGRYKCLQCGFEINLKKGQLVPPCPRCGKGQYEVSTGPASSCQ